MRFLAIMVVSALFATSANAAEDKSVDNAFYVCALIDATGYSSSPCDVSGWGSKVTATIDTTSSEARKMCALVAQTVRSKGKDFRPGWTLEIVSPYSNGKSIAYCPL